MGRQIRREVLTVEKRLQLGEIAHPVIGGAEQGFPPGPAGRCLHGQDVPGQGQPIIGLAQEVLQLRRAPDRQAVILAQMAKHHRMAFQAAVSEGLERSQGLEGGLRQIGCGPETEHKAVRLAGHG